MTVAKPRKRWIVSSQDTGYEDTSSLVARPKGDIRSISQQRVALKRHCLTPVGVITEIKKWVSGVKLADWKPP